MLKNASNLIDWYKKYNCNNSNFSGFEAIFFTRNGHNRREKLTLLCLFLEELYTNENSLFQLEGNAMNSLKLILFQLQSYATLEGDYWLMKDAFCTSEKNEQFIKHVDLFNGDFVYS